MRHGAVSQVNIERDKMVLALYRQAKSLADWPTSQQKLCEIAAGLPVPQFYISSDTAVLYVRNRLFRGVNKRFSNRYKQKLFEALYDKVLELKATAKYQSKPLPQLVEIALMQPAPCAGLSPHWFYSILLGKRKTNRHNKRTKHKHL